MNTETVKQELKKIIEKYDLPVLEKLDKELEIIDMLTERKGLPQNMLSAIRRRFTEVIYSWINLLHSFIIPAPQSLIVNKDSEAFDEKEKDGIYKTMAVLALITRESTRFEANKEQEKEEIKFIKDSFARYINLKPELEKLNSKVIEHWKKEIST